MSRRLSIIEAAQRARVDTATVEAELASGDLRSLSAGSVDAWARARVASIITRTLRGPGGDAA